MIPLADIRRLLADLPGALALLDEVSAFYGDRLAFSAGSPDSLVSTYALDCDAERLRFSSARVILASGSSRQAAAAVHELLHLRLPTRSYPRVRSLEMNQMHQSVAGDLAEGLGKVLNVVDHDIFVADFVSTGLALSDFLGPVGQDPNYKRTWQEMERKHTPQPLMFYWWFWWTLEYVRHYISIEHGVPTAEKSAEKVEKWGSKALRGFSSETKNLRNWIKVGRHKDAATYADSIRELLQIMQMPPPTFYTVHKSPTGVIQLAAL
jgi:hypothetical protein